MNNELIQVPQQVSICLEQHRSQENAARIVGLASTGVSGRKEVPDIMVGDVVIACSDGVADNVSTNHMISILNTHNEPEQMVFAILEEACAIGAIQPDDAAVYVGFIVPCAGKDSAWESFTDSKARQCKKSRTLQMIP